MSGYALIAESLGMGTVRRLALVYYEPMTDITVGDVGTALCGDGFVMRFRANILPVERDDALVPSLLARAKAIYDLPQPPDGRDECKDCGLLEKIAVVANHGASSCLDTAKTRSTSYRPGSAPFPQLPEARFSSIFPMPTQDHPDVPVHPPLREQSEASRPR